MTAQRPKPHDPRFQFAVVMVRGQNRSLRFYIDQLGFRLIADQTIAGAGRWVVVERRVAAIGFGGTARELGCLPADR